MSTPNVHNDDGPSSLSLSSLTTFNPLSVDEIIDSSWMVFRNLEPFLTAICSHEEGQNILLKINQELENYQHMLQKSLIVADHGFSLANDNLALLKCLGQPGQFSDQDIKDYLSDVIEKANTSKEDVAEVLSLVRANRKGIMEAREELEKVNRKIKAEEEDLANQKAVAENRAQFWGNFSQLCSTICNYIPLFGVQESEKVNGLLIFLPLLIPMLRWSAAEL
ncbi:hypothetical protein FRC17_009088 [Serendipita sp. 399]|nr:hypothetical protein FRC17_009088 [Serendipita sp. 399]